MEKSGKSYKTVEYNGFELILDGNKLKRVTNPVPTKKDIHIPKILPSGDEINLICSDFCEGEFGEISIDNRISEIEPSAFFLSHVERVVWPCSCKTIPDNCFAFSSISCIDNILDNVFDIGVAAFEHTPNLKKLIWPYKCTTIPELCFSGSNISDLRNLSNVTSIEMYAFRFAHHIKELDLSGSFVSSIGYKAFEGLLAKDVSLPYYLSKDNLSEIGWLL